MSAVLVTITQVGGENYVDDVTELDANGQQQE